MASWMRLDTRDVSSFEYDGLDATAYGVLMLLAWRSWDHGGVPDDKAVIYRALRGRIDGASFDAAWAQIRPLLDADADGKLRFPWIEEARQELIDHRRSETERKRDQRLKAREGHLSRGTSRDSHGSPTDVPACPAPTDGRTDGRTEEKAPRKRVPAADAASVALPTSLDTAEFRETWAAFLEERRVRRKVVTERAARGLLSKLSPWGAARGRVALQNSIDNGWTGVFEPDEQRGASPAPSAPPPTKAATDRAAYERDVQRRWEQKHTVSREVASPLGGTVKRLVLDGRFPGVEAAERELGLKGAA